VSSELFAQGGYRDLVAVSGAVIYDVSVVEEPDGFCHKGIYPDKALGQEAVRAAQPGRFPWGTREQEGAPTSASGRTGPIRESGAGRAAPSARSVRSKLQCSPSSMPSA
jgi:hypothetical protein